MKKTGLKNPYARLPSKAPLRDQLNNTTSLSNLLLSQLADPSRADDQGDLRETALAEDLGVAEGEEVEDGDGVLLGARDVGVAGLGRDEGPQLHVLLAFRELGQSLVRNQIRKAVKSLCIVELRCD